MTNLILTKFKEANQKLEEGDVIAFGEHLIDLYSNLTCNCFFRDQQEVDYKRQIELIINHSGSEDNFFISLAKGFVYLRMKDETEAFNHLSKAIDLDSSCDLPYSLRASIGPEINSSFEEDAKAAVLLNPTARNYFVLANTYDYKNDESALKNSLIYFGKAIKIRSDFACAYNNRAIRLSDNKDFEGAINDYIKCIEIDKSHWAYYQLWFCLDESKRYDEALKYIELGSKIHSDEIRYQFGLGVANSRVGNYEFAINHYKKYLEANPQSSTAKRNLEICEINIKTQLLTKAKENFHNGDYERANALFEDYLKDDAELNGEDLDIYLVSLLKNKNSDTSFDENNPIYKRLDALKASYFEKEENGEELLEEEENANKLMEYQSTYKIGFGKHEGKILSSIIEEDAEYVLWSVVNLEHFSIDKSLFQSSKLRNEPLFLLALEHNLIKELIIEKWRPVDDDYEYYDDYIHDDYIDDMNGDWGGLYGEEAYVGYWNTQ